MITYEMALRKIRQQLARTYYKNVDGIVVIEEATIEKPYGWFFFYNSTEYLQTQDFVKMMLVGPVVVMKEDGTLYPLSTGLSLEDLIERFEATQVEERFWPPDRVEKYRQLQLRHAVNANDPLTVRNLLDQGVSANTLESVNIGDTVLYRAAQFANLEIIKLLLDYGAEVDRAGVGGATPLMMCIRQSAYEHAKLLIERGADTNAVDSYGSSVLMDVFLGEYGVLGESKDRLQCLHLLLDHGADVNLRNQENQTALMFAAGIDDLEAVRLLIAHGAEVYVRSSKGETALNMTGSRAISRLLRKARK